MGNSRTAKKRNKKRSYAQQLQLNKVHSERNKENIPATIPHIPTTRKNGLTKKFAHMSIELEKTRSLLHEAELRSVIDQRELSLLRKHLSSSRKTIHTQGDKLKKLLIETSLRQRLLRNERRKLRRLRESKSDLLERLDDLELIQLPNAKNATQLATTNLLLAVEDARQTEAELITKLDGSLAETLHLKTSLRNSRRKIHALDMKVRRSAAGRAKAIEKAEWKGAAQTRTWNLKHKGVYKPEVRALARKLSRAGCSQRAIGDLLQGMGKAAGMVVKGKMSARTVERATIEGGVAVDIQLAHELSVSKACSASGDATSHLGDNIEASHIMMKTPDYSNPSLPLVHRSRMVAVVSTVNHTSETQVATWKHHIGEISAIYKRSPFAARRNTNFTVGDFLRFLKAMNGDHAADQKKTVRLMICWKTEVCRLELGWEHILSLPVFDLRTLMIEINTQNVADAGGLVVWNGLSVEERAVYDASAMDALAIRLGQDVFDKLSDTEKHEIDLFFWAGCSMHKELNSVTGGNKAMVLWWDANKITGPMVLANKDNAATLELGGSSPMVMQRAMDLSGRGGVKITSLAGAIFNHKDDKKGCQDAHRNYFILVKGVSCKFPSTSNTRYQSHCEASSELITYLDEYIKFLEVVRDKKEKRNFNHMELNVYKGLQDYPTLTELAVLSLYSQSITIPYMRAVRGRGSEQTNILDLGPLHVSVKDHCRLIISSPDILLSLESESYTTAALDGRPWEKPLAVSAVLALSPLLPHLKPLLVAFFKGALETWERFTSEFETGGAVDLSTAEERDLAFMPSTNDANEGALGQWRRFSRHSPNTTIGHFSAQAAFNRNDTQAFMDAEFESDDHTFIMQEARAKDASKIESRRRKELVEFTQATVEKKREEIAARKAKKDETTARLGSLEVVLVDLASLTVKQIDDQLEVHRRDEIERGISKEDRKIPLKSHLKNRAAKLECLEMVVQRYNERLSGSGSGIDGEDEPMVGGTLSEEGGESESDEE